MISRELFLRAKENLKGQQNGPYCIDLVINNFCNLRCSYCFGSINHSNRQSLSKDILIKILDSAKKLDVQEISLTSLIGEPTIFKDIKFLMEEIKKRNFIGTLLTNGAVFDLEFAKFMQKISWDILILSLDSFNPSIQYRIRPARKNKDYLKNIHEFLQYTVESNPNLHLNFNMVVTNLNYNDVEEYFKIVESYGAKNITLLKLVKMNENYEKLMLTESQMIDFKNRLKNMNTPLSFNRLEWLTDNYSDSTENIMEQENNLKRNCHFHFYKVLIACDGRILKCNGDPQKTGFNVYYENLYDIYYKLLNNYKHLRINPSCWDICCSPIKALNQEIDYYLEHNTIELP